jgi:acyl-coenzyme A thioesterase PaaI-like protein
MKTNEVSLSTMRWLLFMLSVVKIPLIGFVRPKLLSLNDKQVEVLIKRRRRTKNHLNSLYFGALAVGADVAGGIHAFYFAKKYGKQISFAFKSMDAQFLKRAESHTTFVCESGEIIEKAVLKSIENQERINEKVTVTAYNTKSEAVATFVMEISIKVLN